jgi:hypothetical protein
MEFVQSVAVKNGLSSDFYLKEAEKKHGAPGSWLTDPKILGLQHVSFVVYDAAKSALAKIKMRIPHHSSIQDFHVFIFDDNMELRDLFAKLCQLQIKQNSLSGMPSRVPLTSEYDHNRTEEQFVIRAIARWRYDPVYKNFSYGGDTSISYGPHQIMSSDTSYYSAPTNGYGRFPRDSFGYKTPNY